MIPLIPLGGFGITSGIYQIIRLIDDHRSDLIGVAKVNNGDDFYSFIALFREKNSIGRFVAFINEWGTNDGLSGEGGGGYEDMIQYLATHNIKPQEYNLSRYPDELRNTIGRDSKEYQVQRMEAWQEIVLEMCNSLNLPRFIA
jgi:hypothetical protein